MEVLSFYKLLIKKGTLRGVSFPMNEPQSLEDSIEAIEQPRRSTGLLASKTKPAAVTMEPSLKRGKRTQPETTAIQEANALTDLIFPPSPDVSEVHNRSLSGITAEAKKLREMDPQKYGIKGAREAMAGYVKGGWRLALKDAAEVLGCKSNRNKQSQKETLARTQKEAKQEYLKELRLLQVKYFPLIGRKVSAKATKQADEEESKSHE